MKSQNLENIVNFTKNDDVVILVEKSSSVAERHRHTLESICDMPVSNEKINKSKSTNNFTLNMNISEQYQEGQIICSRKTNNTPTGNRSYGCDSIIIKKKDTIVTANTKYNCSMFSKNISEVNPDSSISGKGNYNRTCYGHNKHKCYNSTSAIKLKGKTCNKTKSNGLDTSIISYVSETTEIHKEKDTKNVPSNLKITKSEYSKSSSWRENTSSVEANYNLAKKTSTPICSFKCSLNSYGSKSEVKANIKRKIIDVCGPITESESSQKLCNEHRTETISAGSRNFSKLLVTPFQPQGEKNNIEQSELIGNKSDFATKAFSSSDVFVSDNIAYDSDSRLTKKDDISNTKTSFIELKSDGFDVSENDIPSIYPIIHPSNILYQHVKDPPNEFSLRYRVNLDPIPDVGPLHKLNAREVAELELTLQIGDKYDHSNDNSWRDDWNGNLQLIDKDIVINRGQLAKNPHAKKITLPFCECIAKQARHSNDFKGVTLLFSYIYHMTGTPHMAKKIMAYYIKRVAKTIPERLEFILEAIRRISYDPIVLEQDGWTTTKSEITEGCSGGAYLIGRRAIWQRYEAVVIAFVRDEEIGDLWKAMWLEDNDTFDLEADELQDAMKKWERKHAVKQKKAYANIGVKPIIDGKMKEPKLKLNKSIRFEASRNFTVDGIGHGIILATSYKARCCMPWPARIMHVNEMKQLGSTQISRRSSSRNEIHVVFLAPYWNGVQYSQSMKSKHDIANNSRGNSKNLFSSGSLFELESIDVSADTIKKYPYSIEGGFLSIDKLRTEFSFLGLSSMAFHRFLDSHRLAMALKFFSQNNVGNKKSTLTDDTKSESSYSSMIDTHPLSIQTYLFPTVLLNLPFDYILSNMPTLNEQLLGEEGGEMKEPIIQLDSMIKSLTPPLCWGYKYTCIDKDKEKVLSICDESVVNTAESSLLKSIKPPGLYISSSFQKTTKNVNKEGKERILHLHSFASDYLLKNLGFFDESTQNVLFLEGLGIELQDMVNRLRYLITAISDTSKRKEELRLFLCSVLMAKSHGEDILYAHVVLYKELDFQRIFEEWLKTCERIYKYGTIQIGHHGGDKVVTAIITDSRCNQHLTATGSFERAVRLPAAIRGAKKAGAGTKSHIPIIHHVEESYMVLAEEKVLPKAHKATYLKRLKEKIAALPSEAMGVPLTDDSEGEGGEDTMGSRGSYTAALVGVAAALKGVDMIVGGECVNAFCAVRPPGHHAGRELHPMNAISNGFCLLNAAACASLYATSPQSEGGLGLKRVCVIDFDVHHGNGTQDILCSTQDCRFLYVSTHAGGAHINGYDNERTDNNFHFSLNARKNDGIFPGRCGDSSPHVGVLNIPLGQKVTAQAIGTALVSKVSPTVEAFAPDLIILSAGFDAHKNDPLGMGGLSAIDFGSITAVACNMARKTCSGRLLSILEGGYGVPCCQPLVKDFYHHDSLQPSPVAPICIPDLKDDLPETMEDNVDVMLQQKLDRCHHEGFIECVKEHICALVKYSNSENCLN